MDKQEVMVGDKYISETTGNEYYCVGKYQGSYIVINTATADGLSKVNSKWFEKMKLIERNGKPVREKPKTLEDRVKVKYGGVYEVRMLKIENGLLMLYNWGDEYKHIEAQSMQGFAGYVYDVEDFNLGLVSDTRPVLNGENKTIQPLAVLFYKDS